MEALQIGAVQMLAPSLAKFGPLGVKEFEVFDFPFIFNERIDSAQNNPGTSRRRLLAKLRAHGHQRAGLLG